MNTNTKCYNTVFSQGQKSGKSDKFNLDGAQQADWLTRLCWLPQHPGPSKNQWQAPGMPVQAAPLGCPSRTPPVQAVMESSWCSGISAGLALTCCPGLGRFVCAGQSPKTRSLFVWFWCNWCLNRISCLCTALLSKTNNSLATFLHP